jgi:hypothetical protein
MLNQQWQRRSAQRRERRAQQHEEAAAAAGSGVEWRQWARGVQREEERGEGGGERGESEARCFALPALLLML